MKKLIYLFLLFFSCFLATSFSPKFKPTFSVRTVVIDAGHGGKDPGCHGKKYKEKDIALAVALKLGTFIEKNLKDVKVIYTRKTDVFIELQERANIANKAKADLFICIHCNSACYRDKKLKRDICKDFVHGAETYVMGLKNEQGKLDVAKRENSAILLEDDYVQKYDGFDPNSDESYIIMSMFTDTYLNQSLSFASKLQNQYTTKGGRKDKGVKRASLWVLWRTFMPSVLTEIGYLTNPEEEKFLGTLKGQEYVAACIFRAFRSYKDEIDGTVKKYDDAFENMQNVTPINDSIDLSAEEKEIGRADTLKNDTLYEEKIVEKPKEKIQEKPKEIVVEKPKETPVIKKEEKPKEKIEEKPKDSIVIKPLEKPTEAVVVKPKDTIVAKPTEKPFAKGEEKTEEKPKEAVVVKPKDSVVVKPIEKPIEKPLVKVEEKPKDLVVKPKDSVVIKPIEKPIEKPIVKVEEKPKEVAVEKPKEIISEKPFAKSDEKPKENISSPIVYKVQILLSEKKLDLKSDKFKGVEKPGEYIDKGIYKYTAGEFDNQKDAANLQLELRTKGFKDAFVIKMQDGKRILSK